MMTLIQRHERIVLGFIVFSYLVLAIGFSFGPIFEGPSELTHYRFIPAMLEQGTLPDPTIGEWTEYHQPPLYYVLATPLILVAGNPSLESVDELRNPYFGYEFSTVGNDNKNMLLHPESEKFPYTQSRLALAVHLARGLSVLLGLGTLIVTWLGSKELWPAHPNQRLLMTGFVAFFPEFLFMTSQVNNDVGLFFLSSLSLYLVLRMVRRGPSWRLCLLLGIALGLALLTKISALFLVFPVGAAFLMDRRHWRFLLPTLGIVVLVAGWWYLRNFILYGDPTLSSFPLTRWKGAINGGRIDLDYGWRQLPYVWSTFWARFGNMTVPVGEWLYRTFNTIVIVTLFGVAIALMQWFRAQFWRKPLTSSAQVGIVAGIFVIAWVIYMVYTTTVSWVGNHGHYMLYGIMGFGAVFALGITSLIPASIRDEATLGVTLFLGSVAGICLYGYFLPAFRPSPMSGESMTPLAYRFGNVVELIGIEPTTIHAHPSELVGVKLYWRALRETDRNLTFHLHTLGGNVGRSSFPGTGNLLSTEWIAGQTWSETYYVRIPNDSPDQILYTWVVRVEDSSTGEDLPATIEGSNDTFVARVGQIAIHPKKTHAGDLPPNYQFGDIIGLQNLAISEEESGLTVCLDWVSLKTTLVDYTIFYHVVGSSETEVLGQADRQPHDGSYPTSVWFPGEEIHDCAVIDVSSTENQSAKLLVGIYDQSTGERLPVTDQNGNLLPDQQIVVQP